MFPSRSDFLYGLSERHLQRLAEIASRAPMTGGELLMHEGRVGEVIYMIERGAVELKTRVDEDFDLPVSVLRDPGQCFGTSALVAPHQYSVSAYCLNEGSLIVFPRVALQGLIEADAELGRIIMINVARQLLERLIETRRELIVHFKSIMGSLQ